VIACLAAAAGCAAAPATTAPRPRPDPCAQQTEPAFPDTAADCIGAVEPTGGPSCVPAYARGRELARDDQLHMVVYQACLPESGSPSRAPVRVDPRRVMIERTGAARASDPELEVVAGWLGVDISTREPELALGPQVAACRQDRLIEGEKCLRLHLLARRPDLAALMAALAKLMPLESRCIPMKVDFGVREGCPVDDYRGPIMPLIEVQYESD